MPSKYGFRDEHDRVREGLEAEERKRRVETELSKAADRMAPKVNDALYDYLASIGCCSDVSVHRYENVRWHSSGTKSDGNKVDFTVMLEWSYYRADHRYLK